jgi:hypothetical protein
VQEKQIPFTEKGDRFVVRSRKITEYNGSFFHTCREFNGSRSLLSPNRPLTTDLASLSQLSFERKALSHRPTRVTLTNNRVDCPILMGAQSYAQDLRLFGLKIFQCRDSLWRVSFVCPARTFLSCLIKPFWTFCFDRQSDNGSTDACS